MFFERAQETERQRLHPNKVKPKDLQAISEDASTLMNQNKKDVYTCNQSAGAELKPKTQVHLGMGLCDGLYNSRSISIGKWYLTVTIPFSSKVGR